MSMGSQMSMVSSAEEEDDDLKDEDAISVVHGISMAAPRKTEVEESTCVCVCMSVLIFMCA